MKTRVISASLLRHSLRFDGSYHNAEMNIYADIIDSHPHNVLSNLCTDIFTSGRNKRVYTTAEFGNPFLSNSDVVAADPLASCNFSSKKYGTDERAMLKGGMILTGRVGAIGQTAYVPKFWEKYQAMGSDNIIRIVPKDNSQGGYIYAYLTSKIGTLALWKLATGGVQPFITDAMVGSLPIPRFPEKFQKEVDALVQESARLREEATDALAEAHKLIEKNIQIKISSGRSTVSIKDVVSSHQMRLEGAYYQTANREVYDSIIATFQYEELGSLTSSIFRPGIFKRKFVTSGGVTFLGGADILMAIPNSDKQLSKSQVASMPELIPKEGWILATCGGTIGKTVLVDKQLAECAISQHVMRLVPNGKVPDGYLFAFLSSKIGFNLITLFTYGSVIPQVEPHHLKLIPVPILQKEIMEEIQKSIMKYKAANEEAKYSELKAVAMVESEIEKWAK